MGKCFSDAVEQALRYIYYDVRTGQGQEGLQLLQKASAEGDGDASCILARCYCGRQYVWRGHEFPEDDGLAKKLLHQSVEQGSALGVLVTLRSGLLTPSVQRKMPFASLKEAFDIVLQKAQDGDAFCQYTIGNSYFWEDTLRIQDKGRASFATDAEYRAYRAENISRCEEWHWMAFRGGVHFAGTNLYRYYTKGEGDLIPARPEKAADIWRIGAERGYPIFQYSYALELNEKNSPDAAGWFKLAAEGGEGDAWYYVGIAYEHGNGVPQDIAYAAKCYDKGLSMSCADGTRVFNANALGALYCKDNALPKDYDKAFRLLNYAYTQGSVWGVKYLGECYFRGWGTPQDFVRARELLEKGTGETPKVFFMLGYLYGRGLGVPADIQKAVLYLQRAGDDPEAKEELLRYKKTLLGKWKVR
ncbi:MAG: hypothetical protein NC254_04060 [bacterium]|nr:hypothetical protein [bacterium]